MSNPHHSPAGALCCALGVFALCTAVAWARARAPPSEVTGLEPLIPNVNAAPARHLLLLPRVGPVRAHAIVAERARAGPFAHLADLQRVRGIGPKTVAGLEHLATAGP